MPTAEAVAPPHVGPYHLHGLIGGGASGEVHRAIDSRDGQPVALKLMHAAGTVDARRFAAEAAAAQRLRHPHIVRVLDAGVDEGRGWIAMEPLAGCDLQRYTRATRLLPEPVVLRIGERVASALACAHAEGIVHRDVKPSNVIVDWTADRLTLTDFGIAHLADGERTATGVVLGTPAYMAPEQLAGAPASAAGDLYALGVMMFELLAGRRPHDAPTLGELLRRVASEPAPDLASIRAGLPPALTGLIAALLAVQPAARPPNADAVAQQLASLRADMASAPGGPSSRP